MGNWNINIQGVGCHHNGKPDIDADLAAAKFVEELIRQGHAIESATFTYGGKTGLLSPQNPTPKPSAGPTLVVGGSGTGVNFPSGLLKP